MNFLYPGFLYALFAVAIPIIIHLFNFRSFKVVYFSRVDLLKNIQLETKSKSTLKDILILIARILTIISLVFAFAQPYIPSSKNDSIASKKKIIIYIDNSFSSESEGKYGKIIETAKKKALDILYAHKDLNDFLFISNDLDPRQLHFVAYEQMKDFIIQTDVSPSFRYLSEIIEEITEICNEYNPKNSEFKVFLISDFQKSSSDINNLSFNPEFQYVLLPLEPKLNNNLYIDSVWFENPERPISQNDEIFIHIVNKSQVNYSDMPLKLYINNQLKSSRAFNIMPNSDLIQKISFSNENTGIISGMVEISDFPVTFDNTFYFTYSIEDKNNVLIFDPNGSNKFIDNIFKGLDYVNLKYSVLSDLKSDKLSVYQTIILNGINHLSDEDIRDLSAFVSSGGKLILFIPYTADFSAYNKLFNQLNVNLITGNDTTKKYAAKLNYDSRIFKNVFKKKDKNIDFPYFYKRVKFTDQTYANEEVVLSSENNEKLISSATFNDGIIYIFAGLANEKSGNLVFHPIWVPMIYNMVIFNTTDENIFYTIGKENNTEVITPLFSEDKPVNISNINNTVDFIPLFTHMEGNTLNIFWNDQIETAGHYHIKHNEQILKGIAMNYDRKESDMEYLSGKDLNDFVNMNKLKNVSSINPDIQNVSEYVKTLSDENKFWKLFLFLALGFLLFEIIIIRVLIFRKNK
jgi:hypothetical protein